MTNPGLDIPASRGLIRCLHRMMEDDAIHSAPENAPRSAATDAVQVFVANALLLPTGLVTAGVLTRVLGPDGYGLFTLAATLISWVSWSLAAVLEQTSVATVARASDWRAPASTVIRTHAACGLLAAAVFWVGADAIGAVLSADDLAFFLRLFAFELVVFALAQGYGVALIARGQFRDRAVGTASRWLARMLLMVVLVGSGLSILGAILGSIGGFLTELLLYRRRIRIPLRRSGYAAKRLWEFGAPLMLMALCLQFFNRLDILALKGFGGSIADTGIYGAAQNLATPPALVAISFAPLLLSTLTRLRLEGSPSAVKTLAGDSLRFAICLLPFAAAAAGAASEVVVLLFGEHFAPAGPLLARLIFAEVALVVVSIATAILVAQAQHRWLSAFGAAIVVLALVGHGFAVPRFGPIGAASVTLFVASVGAVATAAAAYAGSRLLPPFATIGRTALVAAAAYWATSVFPTPGLGVVVKLIGVAAGIPVLFYGLGEIGQRERAQIAGLLGLERRSGDAPKDP